jgi:antitoxin PrlF
MQVTSLSSKGQIVIPNDIRKELKLSAGSHLAVFTDGSNVLLKPIEEPRLESFQQLAKESRKVVKKVETKKEEVNQLIESVRNARRS